MPNTMTPVDDAGHVHSDVHSDVNFGSTLAARANPLGKCFVEVAPPTAATRLSADHADTPAVVV